MNALKAIYSKYERFVPIFFFVMGFLFDMTMLTRIDEFKVIVQQAIYLVISSALVGVELVEQSRPVEVPAWFAKAWRYREALLHFLMGTLLNSYTIFYFKSASAFSSFLFIALLVGVLTLNEFKHFGRSQSQVHTAFLSLCLISFLVSLAPIVMGFMGVAPFMVAVALAAGFFYVYFVIMRAKLGADSSLIRTHLLFPFTMMEILFVVLYFAHAIPPVPLSVKYLGIYHHIEKKPGVYELSYTRPGWKFWQHGDQTFLARPGDEVYAFAQIFSPTRFDDNLQVRWLFDDPKRGWQSSDAIPLRVTGGREEGYRLLTKKSNFQPGKWRVQVETRDSLEIGRIGFEIIADDSTDPVEVKNETR